ncbi:hypothetical protein, partial [Escherichia coli]|uniref:hypothetical protein n=1 Tax=Escherichia coli TaxID=562 RepID=UPI0019D4512E
ILTFQNHTNRPLTDFGGKTSIFSHPVYLFLREFSLQDFRGGSLPGGGWFSSPGAGQGSRYGKTSEGLAAGGLY